MIDSVKELDAALVEFNKVADLSSSQLEKFVDRAFEAGEALGRTGTEVIQATAIFKQAGYSVEESLSLANSALVMKNVSENIESTAAAASDLIAVMKGFDLAVSDSMSIVDMINNVSNNLPISFGAIDEGLTRISGTLAQTGTSIQETIGLITGGFASLRNVEKVSSGLIQISQRLRGIGEDGEAIDGLAPKLQSMFKEIAGIDISDTNGELRSTFDILSDLAKVSDDLNSKEKQLLFQSASGTRQVTVLNSIIQNWDDVTLAIDKATNSTGSAMRENEKFLDSIQGKTNRLASSFQMLASNTIESGAIKGLIDFANALVQVIDKIGPLQTALLAITGFTTLFSNGKLAGTVASLGKSFLNMGKTFLMLPKTIKQSNENFIGPMQAGTQAISKFRLAAFGAVAAVTLIKGAFDEYTRSLEEQKRKSDELLGSWESTRETLASNKATVEELKSEFADLSNGVDNFGNNVSLTSDEFSRYHQITNQIAGMFPEMVRGYDDQGNAILTVKGNVEQLTEAYKAQEAAARDAIMGNAHVVYGQQRRTFTSSSDIFGIEQTGLAERIEVSKRLLKEMERMQSESAVNGSVDLGALLDGSAFRSGANAYADVIEELNLALTQTSDSGDLATFSMSEDDIKKNRAAIETGMRIYTSEMKSASRGVIPIMEAYLFNDDRFSQLGEDAQNMLIGVISSLDPEYIFKHSDARDLMDSVFGQIVNPVTSSTEGQKNIMSAFADADAFRAGKKTVEEYAQTINGLRDTLASAGVSPEIAVKFIDMAEIDNVDALIENVKLKLQDEFDDNVGELTLKQLRLGGDLKIEDGTLLSWQEFLALITQSEAVLSSLTIGERIAAIASAASVANTAFSEQGYSAAVTKEQYDELAKAGEEYVSVIDNTNGYLSINKQKLDALILSKRNEEKANIAIAKAAKLAEFDKNAKEIQSLSDQVNLLGDAYDDTKQSLLDKNAALIDNQSAILEEVKNLDLQASALEYVTSAYKRWLDAKNAPEAGDMYDETLNAWGAIDKGLESGKIGTNEFTSASDWLIPKEVSEDGAAAIAKYKKSVMKYFTEDSSGANKFIDSLMAGGFMEQLSDGSYATTAKANVEEIAKSLNLTEGAVESLFLVLKDYGWNVELNDGAYETTAAAQELAKATDDLATAQDKLDKAKLSGASAEEIKTLEKNVDSAQEKVDKLSATEIEPEISTGEKLLSEIEKLQADVDKLLINIPATLNPDLNADLLAIQTSLDTDANLIAKARIDGDPTLLNEKLAELTSETDPNGNPKTPIQLSIDAQRTAAYKAAILEIEAFQTTPPSTTLGVTVNPNDVKGAGDTLDGIVAKPRNAVITVDTKELSDAEKWLAEFQAKMDKLDPEGKEQSLAGSHSGTGYQSTPEEIQAMWASQETPKSPSRVDPDQNEVRLLDTLNEAEKKANEVRETLKNATALALKDELPKFETIDQQAEYLQKKIADLEKVRENLKVVGFDLTPAEEGKLDAYKAALAEISTPITTPVSLETSGALESANNLEKAIESKNPTMTVDVKYSDASGGNFVPKVDMKYAKGTQKAKKGVALTGEQGVETVITKDGFYTVGHDGPELVNLRGGEEILNDKETKKLFNGAEKRTKGQAFATGTGGFLSNLINSVKAVVKKVADVVKANKPTTKTVATGNNRPGGSNNNKGGGGGGSSASAPVEEAKEEVKEEIKTDFEDWIPRLLDNVRKETDKILANAEKQISYQSQNSEIEKALANNTKLMGLNAQATNRYLQQASQVGLSADLIAKVQNGSIDIALYDENTRKLIADYQKWYDLAQKTKDTITSLQEEQRKLAMSKLDNVQGYYENRIGVYGNRLDIANSTIELGQSTGREIRREDYAPMIGDVNTQLALLRQEKAEYERTFTELVLSGVIKEGSNDWYQYTANIDDMQKSILQASLSLDEFNDLADAIAVNNLNVAIKYLNTVQGTLESVQGLRQAQGKELTAVDYEHLISVGMQQVSTLEAQNLELLKQQEGLDVLSSAYQEIQDQIDGNLNGIWNIKTSQEGWNDAITDLNINAIKKTNDEYNRQLETMRAIEELEKAKQRRSLVYREGKGFVYEADQGALRDAQRTVDQINIDNLIASLEESKANDNVYDSTGNLLGKLFTGLDGVDFSGYLQSVSSGNETSALLANAIKSIDWNSIKTASGMSTSVEFSGGINLYGVDNVQDLAKAINYRLGGYVTQGLYNND
jgi:TP901 family phage tail tape measure protein